MENEKKLVDLDSVIEQLENEWGYEGMREELYKLPTVDAVEVVHGRYVHKGAWHIECSECQHILAHIGESKNYCPNCGAKMDGGNEDG